ncbi:MAG: formate--phosphoribosylaminoimidazolecarboxamide ligase [Methanosarcinales archaeon]|nr:formate--phosphoribosylaminoimidazolecarboxamide ligase [Methanosarcinales archaeon]
MTDEITEDYIRDMVEDYDKDDLTIATVCSHTSLQIFNCSKKKGVKTLGICIGEPPGFYDAFPLAKPDNFMSVGSYMEIIERTDELAGQNAIIIPHGSLVEYMGASNFTTIKLPTFGNRKVLEWESDRRMERKWLEGAGIPMPRKIHDPKDIDSPVMVKYHGAKGGRGFFVAKNYSEFREKVDPNETYDLQEFVLGTRYYLHYFYSPISTEGYRLNQGTLELFGMDRRVESNADEIYRLGSPRELIEAGIRPTFVVTGNVPLVARESLLPQVFEMGEKVIEKSIELFGGLTGPFCLETVVTDQLEFKVFEISARIVAGTNPYISGSPYSDLIQPGMSTGRRIAVEIKKARDMGCLEKVLT